MRQQISQQLQSSFDAGLGSAFGTLDSAVVAASSSGTVDSNTVMSAENLRVALFSGNYNYTKDGANQALNKLVAFLEEQGAKVRVYSPTAAQPAFKHSGTVVSVPSFRIPSRGEYRFSLGMPKVIRDDLAKFSPNIIHVSAPDLLGQAALKFAKKANIATVASVHTRFDNYLRYYKLGWLEGALKRRINRFYNACDRVLAPNKCMMEVLVEDGIVAPLGIWGRGVDHAMFSPSKRDMAWRRQLGFSDDEQVILFVGRLVKEKGLDTFAKTIEELQKLEVPHRVLVVGDGPERAGFESRLKNAVFTGFLVGEELGRAYASADVMLNPSLTEAFGNVMLEGLASGLPSVCARATGSNSLIVTGVNGYLVEPDNAQEFAAAISKILRDDTIKQSMQRESTEYANAYSWPLILKAVIEQYQGVMKPF